MALLPAKSRALFAMTLGVLGPLLLGVGAALAQAGPGASSSPRSPMENLTPEQQAKLFPDLKRLTIEGHRLQVKILEESMACMEKVSDTDALLACRRQEVEAYRAQGEKHRAAMRDAFIRNGIRLPSPPAGSAQPR
jgi:hypothetical protein